MTGLWHQLTCGKEKDEIDASSNCADRAACERLTSDGFEYPANGLIRAADAWVLLLSGKSWREASSLMDYAAAEECGAVAPCPLKWLEECIDSF